MSALLAKLDAGLGGWPQLRRLGRLLQVIIHIFYGLWLAMRYRAFADPHRPLVRQLAQHWLRQLLVILHVRVKVYGHLPGRTMFLVSNHVSWLDIPVINACQQVHFLSKAEVKDWPLIGPLATAAGTLYIRRGGGESARKAEEIAGHLGQGRSILVFPEGTTTRGEPPRRFFAQLFAAPLLAEVPVLPLTIRYLDEQGQRDPSLAYVDDDAFHTHLWQLLRRDEVQVELCFGVPIAVQPDMTRQQLCEQALEQVRSRLS